MSPELAPGSEVSHPRFGSGVIVRLDGSYADIFFGGAGKQTVALSDLTSGMSWDEQIVASLQPASARSLGRLRLALEAQDLPFQAGAAALTAAKVDLLPHPLVLTHRVATTAPRRFLIADDVGLGKTIETALILRELASRRELQRALMVVPAGLVENWRRELNDVFNLDFEVFGSDGDVTDRKSNAFATHDRLIASIDTLKRPERMKRLAEAPAWDLVVFDEAHHLTATRLGNRVQKTQNYRLAELLRTQARDLLLLSATPHQGDHYRFLALIRLLQTDLFADSADMLDNRHRLNSVVIRRTKADACRDDGTPLFARRQIHTELFRLRDQEQAFYQALNSYIEDGYDLAAARGGQGRAIGFVMTVFQKIASSSFAAVRRTLERRLLMLTLREAVDRDHAMDVPARDALLRAARDLLLRMHGLPATPLGFAAADEHLAKARYQLLKKLRLQAEGGQDNSEVAAETEEETATLLAEHALPEERQRIQVLLAMLPELVEAKTVKLLEALGQIWGENPREKVIIFTTYLGSVDTLKDAIERRYPGQGVDVLKGGDQGAKTAAERRFRRPDGPRVLISTAAGREGINLQFARVLFNHDLPWNPMDLEQRIGRIHRYGQNDTVQVYNLVATDTIEGKVYLLLEHKIKAIAAALGKTDQHGEVTEDLRTNILGQLGEHLSFNHLYQQALADPTLRRTDQELEAALHNASQAREVVSELFQDLDTFRLEDFGTVDAEATRDRLRAFVIEALHDAGTTVTPLSPTRFRVQMPGETDVELTSDRDEGLADERLFLVGLEQPLVQELLRTAVALPADKRALLVRDGQAGKHHGVWELRLQHADGRAESLLLNGTIPAAGGVRFTPYAPSSLEHYAPPGRLSTQPPTASNGTPLAATPEALRSYLVQTGKLLPGSSYQAKLLGWLDAIG